LTPATTRPALRNRFSRPQACGFRRSVDLAGQSVALCDDIPAMFDGPLAPHHKMIGRWAVSREPAERMFTRPEARRHIERLFGTAIREILKPIDLADLRITVLRGHQGAPTAIAIVCESLGQLDLGWIETSDAPMSWRAAAYRALEKSLGRALPVFGYQDLLNEISLYYWDGETDDEAVRQALIDYHGADPDDLDGHMLPSEMNERRPEWMIAANAAEPGQLPTSLRQKLRRLRETHQTLGKVPPERDAWQFDLEIIYDYVPDYEKCSSLPPLTLVPFDQFSRELDDIARSGMEMGFMDVVGLCQLPDADRVGDWFASLQQGADFLSAAQDLIQLDPAKL
jgi:hypothetical protein